jgi:hypothetical protein
MHQDLKIIQFKAIEFLSRKVSNWLGISELSPNLQLSSEVKLYNSEQTIANVPEKVNCPARVI